MKPASPALIALLNSSEQFIMADLYTFTLVGGGVHRYSGGTTAITDTNRNLFALGPKFERSKTHVVIGVQVDELDVKIYPEPSDMLGSTPFLQTAWTGQFDGAVLQVERAFMWPSYGAVVGTVVMFAGRLIPEKQVTLAVAAIGLAAERIEGLRGEVFGGGPEREALDAAIAEHGLERVVTARGFTETETVDAEMRRAMCLLLTSRREGYGLVVVEAAARATPSVVVAGEDNAATELIEEGVNGTVAPSADPHTVAEAIVRVHEAGLELRESTARWFAQNADRLSLEHSLREVIELYAADLP